MSIATRGRRGAAALKRKRAKDAMDARTKHGKKEMARAAAADRALEVRSRYPKGHKRITQTEINAARDRAALSPKRKPAGTPAAKPAVKPAEKFGAAFKKHRAAGKKTFTWKGKKYHTRTAEGDAKKNEKKVEASGNGTTNAATSRKDTPRKKTQTQRYRERRRRAPGRVR